MFAFAGVALETIFDKRRGAWVYIAKTSAFSLLTVIVVLMAVVLSGLGTPPEDTFEPLADRFINALVVAPLLENLILVGFAEFFLAMNLKDRTIVVIIAVLSAIAHGIVADWRAVSGFIGFGTMTYSYLLWHECRFRQRFFITVMQHVLFNTPAFVILSISQARA